MTQDEKPAFLRIDLLSDSTFSRGEGTAGIVDTDIDRDDYGMPCIGGKTVRGLLRDTWLSMAPHFPDLEAAAERVLGRSQSLADACRLRIGDALLPEPIRRMVRQAVERQEYPLTPAMILDGFTCIRYQTAEDRETGAPDATTLRSSRLVIRGCSLEARLTWLHGYQPEPSDLRLLSLCVLATRHGGLLRNRGRGHLQMTLDGDLAKTRHYAEVSQ
ncbi:RAMP superfamily CRISPR-associated protein [Candidatus Chloroploca sp. Khr17]|uniref:RAMP superfamily CRISPR-associated protein n=1 Tax=Candidatus Chloroploca sp. Khr17 TaxID=2496869 RepID=UPI00101CF96A|nr:RAMP superfamily CRISPR-associated protein [Candidatus Chloroploca sp. Khr17]